MADKLKTDICYWNIGPRERRQRSAVGVSGFIFALVLALILVMLGTDRWWRLLLFLPSSIGFIGYLQAREKT